jgi:hypothetical protein
MNSIISGIRIKSGISIGMDAIKKVTLVKNQLIFGEIGTVVRIKTKTKISIITIKTIMHGMMRKKIAGINGRGGNVSK